MRLTKNRVRLMIFVSLFFYVGLVAFLFIVLTDFWTYVCSSCGFTIDRDLNAAINLREKMKKTLVSGVTAEFMRVDSHCLNEDLAINQVKTMAYEVRI